MLRTKGFTLLELIIAIAISIMIAAALYFSLKTALDSWEVSQSRLTLQQVASQLMGDLSEGPQGGNGLRDALEIVNGSSDYLSVVMPWTDDTHDVYTGIYTYSLNKHIKPGTGAPIAEALLAEQKRYRIVPVRMLDPGKSEDYPQVFIREMLAAGTRLRFTFHPNYRQDGDVVVTFRYDAAEQAVFVESAQGNINLSANPFGVRITEFLIRYFDHTNKELGLNGSISTQDVPFITAIEISFTAQNKSGDSRHALTFVSLRNAPFHTGNIILKEGERFPIPNSKEIKALALANLWGIDDKDNLVLEARGSGGKSWVLSMQFSRPSSLSSPLISSYTIEFPEGNRVYTDKPRMAVEAGLDLLSLGPGGLYDYDYEQAGDEEAYLDGKVELRVKRMDITGASIFVRP